MLNLDCMSVDPADYMRFWSKHQNGRKARELFPDCPEGYRTATGKLASYASNKSAAMRCREWGKINEALMYEKICQTIYDGLPEYARW